jgi:hypothetical protein
MVQWSLALRALWRSQRGPQGAIHPQRPAQAAGIGTAASLRQPAPAGLVRALGVHKDIAITIARLGLFERHLLMPPGLWWPDGEERLKDEG